MTTVPRARTIAAVAFAVGFSATGALAWQSTVQGQVDRWGRARAVSVDGAGDVFSAGETTDVPSEYPYATATIVKHTGSTGDEIWRSMVGGGLWSSVTIDASGDAIAAGILDDDHFAVAKVDGASGDEIWRQSVPSILGFAIAWELVLDADENAIATGVTLAGYPYRENFTVAKVRNSDGELLWATNLLGEFGPDNEGRSVTIDANGDVIVTGRLSGSGNARSDFAVVKLSGTDGTEIWRSTLGGTNADDPATASLDESYDIAGPARLAPNGDLVVSGYFVNEAGWSDSAILRLSATDGGVLWRRDFDGDEVHPAGPYAPGTPPYADEDRVYDFAIDGDGNILVSGHLSNVGGAQQFLAKLSGVDGTDLWSVYPADSALSAFLRIALDGDGGFVATGVIEGDLAVARFSGTDGGEIWRVREGIDQEPVSWGDRGTDITVNGSAVVVAASLDDMFAVISLDLETGDGIGSLDQTSSQRQCILELEEDLADVAAAQGDKILACLSGGAKGRLATTIAECVESDADNSLAAAVAATLQDEAAYCGDPAPDFGFTTGLAVNAAATDESAAIWNDIFGSDLDAAVVLKSESAVGASCQKGVAKALARCHEARLEGFVQCEKPVLQRPEDIEHCVGADGRGKVQKSCGLESGKVTKAVQRKCASVDLALVFPGCAVSDPAAASVCMASTTQCRACRAINLAGGLSADCDELDDGVVNSTCP